MKKMLALLCCLLLALAVIVGCSAKQEAEEQTGAAGKAEEVADETRMDSAAADTMIDTMAIEGDEMEAEEETPDAGH